MSFRVYFVVLIVVAGVLIISLGMQNNQSVLKSTPSQANEYQSSTNLLPITKTVGAVTLDVTPLTVSRGEKVELRLTLNTHSVDLDYDFTQIASLRDDRGYEYRAIEWTGGRGGHHLTGNLIFPPLTDESSKLTLVLNGVDDLTEEFSWEVNNY